MASLPSIKLVELRKPFDNKIYKVVGLVDTVKFNIDQRLTKEEVQTLSDSKLYKISINGEKN